MKSKQERRGISVPGKKGFQRATASSTPPKLRESKEEEARRLQRREAAKRTRENTHAVILRFKKKLFADLDLVASNQGLKTGTWIRKLVERELADAIKNFVHEVKVGTAVSHFYGPVGLAKAREARQSAKRGERS